MAVLKIKGMSCNHCVMAVTKALDGVDGISHIKVDLSSGEASFSDAGSVDLETVKDKIRKAGYDVS